MGTQNLAEYDTSEAPYINSDPFGPTHLMFREHPYEVQERRERFMVERITEFMADHERGLFVVDMARWTRVKADNVVPIASKRGKRTISAAGKKRIAAAQRARWAKVKARKKKAA